MISIVVPVYNAARYLERCIRSLVEQTYTDLDIILVDDGSKDSSLQLCNEWAERDERIKVISQINQGVSAARNMGITNAKGTYIMLLDSDDWYAPNACEKMMSLMERNNADCVVCGLNQTHGYIWAPKFDKEYASVESFKKDFAYWLNTELLSSSVNKIYLRDKIKELYPLNMFYGEDLVFVLNYLKHCERIVFIQDPLYQHEVFNYSSLTHTFVPERFVDLESIQRSVLAFAGDERDKSLYYKYVRDAVRCIRMWYKNKYIPYSEKKNVVKQWIQNAYLKAVNISDFKISWKDRLVVYCLRRNDFIGLNLVINGKDYVRSFLGIKLKN